MFILDDELAQPELLTSPTHPPRKLRLKPIFLILFVLHGHRNTSHYQENRDNTHRNDGKPLPVSLLPTPPPQTHIKDQQLASVYAAVSYTTEWTILFKAKPCSPALKKCDICLAEKNNYDFRQIVYIAALSKRKWSDVCSMCEIYLLP